MKSGSLVRNAQASLRGDCGIDDVGIIHTSPCSWEEINSILPRSDLRKVFYVLNAVSILLERSRCI